MAVCALVFSADSRYKDYLSISSKRFADLLPSGRRGAITLIAAGVVVSGLFALRGPQGLQALLAKHREIRRLEEDNAAQMLENQRRKARIERLVHNTAEQEMEIRKQLKLLRPGETTFILPDKPGQVAPGQDASGKPAPSGETQSNARP